MQPPSSARSRGSSTRSLNSGGGNSTRSLGGGSKKSTESTGNAGGDRVREIEELQARCLVLDALTSRSRDQAKVWRKLARARFTLWQKTLDSRLLADVQSAYSTALQFRENNEKPEIWLETARVYMSFGAHQGCFELLQRIIMDWPGWHGLPGVMFMCAAVLRKLGRFRDAIKYVKYVAGLQHSAAAAAAAAAAHNAAGTAVSRFDLTLCLCVRACCVLLQVLARSQTPGALPRARHLAATGLDVRAASAGLCCCSTGPTTALMQSASRRVSRGTRS